MKTIDLETHFVTQSWVDAMYATDSYPRLADDPATGKRRLYYWPDAFEPNGDKLLDRLLDLGEGRIREMDAGGIDKAVVSLTSPGVDHFAPEDRDAACETDQRRTGRRHRQAPRSTHGIRRFGAQGSGCRRARARASREGARLQGLEDPLQLRRLRTLDDKRYWPILAKAEELGVPIYLHPTAPMMEELRTYGLALAGAAFGFGLETATAMMRLVLSGAFDAFPKLTIILGHYGEGLSFLMQRIDHPFVRPHIKAADPDAVPALKRVPSDYLRDNMLVTTSGNYLPAAFWCTRDALGMDKILLGDRLSLRGDGRVHGLP